MAADRKKKPDLPRGKAEREPDSGSAKHPEQDRAEQEEERTLQEKESEGPEAIESKAPEGRSGGSEDEKEPGTEGLSPKVTKEGDFPVVGLGASAGGLEALEAFFGAVPADSGLAYVVISHTNPEHKSMLPDLLRKKAKLPVKVIEEGTAAEPDTVYLPPSDRDPILKGRVFHLGKRPAKSEMHLPVDLFLKHLAADRGELAAGIILSGTGTDGTQGIRLIKEKAGLVMAQSPDSARHAGMPKSAIESGLVDYVLPPAEMPEHLVQYFKQPVILRKEPGDEEKKEPDPIHLILAFLGRRTRQDFSLYKENTLIRRIERRMTIMRIGKAPDYFKLLNENPGEVRTLFQELLIGVTSFFRDPEAFAFLKDKVLPDIISQQDRGPLRAWIPGCATGEEAYSVAIILQESLEEMNSPREVQIFATDIDPKAIQKARQGSYLENIVSDVSPERLKRFFSKEGSQYRIRSAIREGLVFAEQNILADPPFSNVDLLVCRNLLIYLKPDAQNKVIPLFHHALRDDGVLFLGASESVGRFHDLFPIVNKHYSIYRKKNHLLRSPIDFPPAGKRFERTAPEPKGGARLEHPAPSIGEVVEKVLMKEHTPACVVLNQSGEIIHFQGRTSKYLEPPLGAPRWQIADMAREGLRFPLLSAMVRSREEKGEVREKGVRVKINGEYRRIDLVVKTLKEPPFEDCRMVIFEELPDQPPAKEGKEILRPGEEYGPEMERLEQELLRERENYRGAMEELQSSNEELRSSNEELQSSNEELQSTNEELESSREELQSLNEELSTVNSELYAKMAELNEAYKAINTVLNNTRVAIVFLDKELRLTRFTPEASELLNLIESDIGRPFEHISHNLEYENLGEKARRVLIDLSSTDEEVRAKNGSWYHLQIMLYRPENQSIEGVVLTLINIDAQKKAQKELQEMSARSLSSARRFAENIVDTVRESLLVLDGRMRIVAANRSFCETFRTSREETEGKTLFELGNRQWDIPQLRKLLQEIIEQDKTFQDFLVEHRFPEIGFKRILLNARMLRDEGGGYRILLAMNVDRESGSNREAKK